MSDRSRKPIIREKKTYEKPVVISEQMFDTSALACGMCTSGPFPQFACGALPAYD
ncbi:MAG TPA: hypothetical protein VGM37_07830 [Armatimonadota bacterium]